MPIYEYECSKCRCHFEKKQRFYDEAVAICPECQSKSRRVLSPVATIFKGSGFYVTDYRKGGNTEKSENIPPVKSEAKPKEK